MKLIDLNINILLYVVNEDSVHHARVLAWWKQALNDDEALGLPWVVLLGVLRIATDPDVFPRPLTPDAAAANVAGWLSLLISGSTNGYSLRLAAYHKDSEAVVRVPLVCPYAVGFMAKTKGPTSVEVRPE